MGAEGLKLEISGVCAWRIRSDGELYPYLVVEAAAPLRTLNSSPWGGGFGRHRLLINRQVDKLYDCDDPDAEMEAFLRRQRLMPEAAACMLTAAQVAALQALDERIAVQRSGEPAEAGLGGLGEDVPAYATGTTTDAVLVAATDRGPLHRYAGTATEVGYLIGRTVYDATLAAGRRYQAFVSRTAAANAARPDPSQ